MSGLRLEVMFMKKQKYIGKQWDKEVLQLSMQYIFLTIHSWFFKAISLRKFSHNGILLVCSCRESRKYFSVFAQQECYFWKICWDNLHITACTRPAKITKNFPTKKWTHRQKFACLIEGGIPCQSCCRYRVIGDREKMLV